MTIELDLTALLADEHFLAPVAQQEQWQEQAQCQYTDPEAFFPEKGGNTREAKRICYGCPVKDECLTYALDHDERFGIWGGMSAEERQRYKRGENVVPAHSAQDNPFEKFDDQVASLTVIGWSQRAIADFLRCSPGRVATAQHRIRGAA